MISGRTKKQTAVFTQPAEVTSALKMISARENTILFNRNYKYANILSIMDKSSISYTQEELTLLIFLYTLTDKLND